jgi:hypothetical protein
VLRVLLPLRRGRPVTRTDWWALLLTAIGVGGVAGGMVAVAANRLDGPAPVPPARVYVSGVPAVPFQPVRMTGHQADVLW